MAIPFVLPSEDDRSEAELEQLLGELIDINQQIQILLRARMLNRASNSSAIRVCPLPRHHQRNHHHQHQQNPAAVQPSNLPDLVRSSQPSTTPADGRHQRINTDAEASCCYHAKFTTHMLAQDNDASALPLMTATAEVDVDWKQQAERLPFMPPTLLCSSTSQSPPSCLVDAETPAIEDKSLLSKIIPATTSSRSLWTAVICVVGWHIFRAR
ncbi:uncharacterized protein [Atheta coriaria]|uniref:uncharacterized protein isoform X2 n=1 Tax=Dalotia coriaria TaxID=877792 RepID=UPI0031F3A356